MSRPQTVICMYIIINRPITDAASDMYMLINEPIADTASGMYSLINRPIANADRLYVHLN